MLKVYLVCITFLFSGCTLQRGESEVKRQAYPEFLGPDDPDGPSDTFNLESDFDASRTVVP